MGNKHPKCVQKYVGTLEQLADDVEGMSYDAVEDFLDHLADALYRRSQRDSMNNKGKLDGKLMQASFALEKASMFMGEAWEICEPYMDEEDDS